jgi:alkanesulfonate monooxygenase SsuD/methylene tetrahydromethanopterin reductase-like flavin-dependent oxidoreductase (luciferase family)
MATGDVERVLAFAERGEDLGFDGLFAFDHLFPPGAPSDRPSLEAYATLAAVASSTSRVTIGTLVTRASLRSAGTIAKQATTLDDVSGGRFVLGIGTGDAIGRAEHEVFGLPYLAPTIRREHLTETVRAVRALLGGEQWPGGEYVQPIDGPLMPGPVRPGGPRIWVGGMSEGAVRVAAHEADGWNGWGSRRGSSPSAPGCSQPSRRSIRGADLGRRGRGRARRRRGRSPGCGPTRARPRSGVGRDPR